MASFLVTGGAGFVGSHLVEELLRRGEQVRVLDNFSTSKRENIGTFLDHVELIEGDIRSYHTVREAVGGMDIIFHQGALPSVPRSVKDPLTTNDINVAGTLNVLDASRDAGVKRVVFASSSSVYGANPEIPKREEMLPMPISPYAVSKLTGEKYCEVFSQIYGLETVALRYFNVFGPRQDPQSSYAAFIPRFIVGIAEAKELIINGDGNQSRDFTFVSNVVDANFRAAYAEDVSGQVFNIACGSSLTVNEVVDIVRKALGTEGHVKHGPPAPGDVPHSLADITRAREKLGYEPLVPAEEGLRRAVQWFRKEA